MGNGKSESMTTPQAPAIQVLGLEKSYKVLRGVDFEVARESKISCASPGCGTSRTRQDRG
jgi:hypothetical protein